MLIKTIQLLLSCLMMLCTAGCGFHPAGAAPLAPSLHRLYISTSDPYSNLVKYLEQTLAMSHVQVVSTASDADATLNILKDVNSQVLLSVGSSQQTRQYNLITTVEFEVRDKAGRVVMPDDTITESRTITIQSSEILGTSNEASLFYQLMRRSIAQVIIRKLASPTATAALMGHAP